MLAGYRTYISIICMAIYNIVFPWLGIKEISMDELDMIVNGILLIAIAIFHKVHKPKVA